MMSIRNVNNFRKNKLLSIFFSLSLIKVFNIIFKYLIVSLLIRNLGPNHYGIFTWLDSINQYLIIVIGFGFDVYAAKYIVENKQNHAHVNRIISSILVIKSILFLLCLIALFILMFFYDFQGYSWYLFLMVLSGFGEIFIVQWYFQGIQKLYRFTFLQLIIRFFFLLLIFYFINDSGDLQLLILLSTAAHILLGISSIYLVFQYQKPFKFEKNTIAENRVILQQGFLFFTGKISMILNNLGIIFIIGLLFSKSYVAAFDISMKIVYMIVIPFDILQITLFPYFVKNNNKRNLRISILFTFVVSLFLACIADLYCTELVQLLGGKNMLKYAYILHSLVYLIPFISTQIIIGNLCLASKGFYKEYNKSLYYYLLITIITISYYLISDQKSIITLIYYIYFFEIFLFSSRLYFSFKKKSL